MPLYNVQRSRIAEVKTPHNVIKVPFDKYADVMVEVSELDQFCFEKECENKGISYE